MADVIVDQMGEDELRKYYGDEWKKSALIEGAYQAEQFFPQIGGKPRWLLFTAAPLRGAGGGITGSIQTLWDITERKESQEALQRAHDELEARVKERTTELIKVNDELKKSEEKYKTLFDSAPNPFFIMDWKTFTIIDVNATALDCYQQTKDELTKGHF